MIQRASKSDISALQELMQSAPCVLTGSGCADALERSIASQDSIVLVWIENKRALGFVSAYPLGGRGYLSELVVHPSMLEQGIDVKLLQEVEKGLLSRGSELFIADVPKEAAESFRGRGWSEPERILLCKRLVPDRPAATSEETPIPLRTEFSCPACHSALALIAEYPWHELLQCERSGRMFLKVHDLKWAYDLKELDPELAEVLYEAPEDIREQALSRITALNERNVSLAGLEELLAQHGRANPQDKTVSFTYLNRYLAAGYGMIPLFFAALLASLLIGVDAVRPMFAPFIAAAAASPLLWPLLDRYFQKPYRLSIRGGRLLFCRNKQRVSWPIRSLTVSLSQKHGDRPYARGKKARITYKNESIIVYPDIIGFDEFLKTLERSGASMVNEK